MQRGRKARKEAQEKKKHMVAEKKEAEERFLNLTDLQPANEYLFLTYAKYLLKKLKADGSFNDDHYKLSSAGADWKGFNNLVQNSSIAEKSTILSLTDRNKSKTQKEKGELLQDMAQVYDALENDVLEYLR